MTDGAGSADVVNVDAAVVADEESASSGQQFAGMLVWGVVAIVLYTVIRFAILIGFAIPFAILPKTKIFAAAWMLFGQPLALGVAAYATLLTNRRNRPMHLALTVVVFASIFIGHITIGVLNPYISRAVDGLRMTSWVAQAIGIAIGAAIGFAKTKPKDLTIPRMLLAPKKRASAE